MTREDLFNVGEYSGGVARFEKASLGTLETALSLGYLDLDDRQNYAPTTGEILAFIQRNPDFTAHGYCVSAKREDSRITLEGVQLNRAPKLEELIDFINCFSFADELEVSNAGIWVWYD